MRDTKKWSDWEEMHNPFSDDQIVKVLVDMKRVGAPYPPYRIRTLIVELSDAAYSTINNVMGLWHDGPPFPMKPGELEFAVGEIRAEFVRKLGLEEPTEHEVCPMDLSKFQVTQPVIKAIAYPFCTVEQYSGILT